MKRSLAEISDITSLRHADRCYAYLKELLLDGGLEPGDRLSAENIGRQLQISRSPVMDALRRLANEGFIQILPQVGSRVILPDPGEVGDFYKVFAAGEAVIAALAATRRTQAEAKRYKAVVREIAAEAAQAGSYQDRDPHYRLLNLRRYSILHELAHSPIATELAATMWDRADFYSRIAFGSLYFAKWVRQKHAELDEAIADGNASAAKRAVHDHLARAGELVEKELQEQKISRNSARNRWQAKGL
jgi:DNA-binding GntR family transcriptional regulator